MEEWVCVDGCPVKALGEQSGKRHSSGVYTRGTHNRNENVYGSGMVNQPPGTKVGIDVAGYTDSGTAARFFQQFPGEDDLLRESVGTEAQATVIRGDCVEVMAEMEENSVDAIVCDPPYMLRFMGKKWDQPGAFVERQPERSNKWDMQAGNHNPCNPQDSARTKRVENQRQQEWHERWAREALRVLRPGGHMLAAGGTRTFHRLVCAIEDAGFEIRDTISHIYGSGFPKSLNIEKALTKMQGQKRRAHGMVPLDGPESARMHAGGGSALKPAFEPWTLARKPLAASSVARNVLATGEWLDNGTRYKVGTSGLNIDESRVGNEQVTTHSRGGNEAYPKRPGEQTVEESGCKVSQNRPKLVGNARSGRWPSNLLLSHVPASESSPGCERVGVGRVKGNGKDYSPARNTSKFQGIYGEGSDANACNAPAKYGDPDGFETVEKWECARDGEGNLLCPIALLDEQSGVSKGNGHFPKRRGGQGPQIYGNGKGLPKEEQNERHLKDPISGASRFFQSFPPETLEPDTSPGFFYCAKSSKRDRTSNGAVVNDHPTCKPASAPNSLMRYLVKLVTPSGGTVLDPFAGSFSTGVACIYEEFNFIGIEQDSHYCDIGTARLVAARADVTTNKHNDSLF